RGPSLAACGHGPGPARPATTRYSPASGAPPPEAGGLAVAGPARGTPPPAPTPAATFPAPSTHTRTPTAPGSAAVYLPPAAPVHRPGHRCVPSPGPVGPWSPPALAAV